ncbi:DUF4369 domain-containing protein [Flavobacterium sp. ASW18X]|uniref:DUF4369 domain-containing protein n=1 Tax=Flavobacterium sp. ASW18X TaxID=2572595 RepID=UPI001F109288|nr:DUF4369 domain-containing protein [Flavobacterium sp. ASW18X]
MMKKLILTLGIISILASCGSDPSKTMQLTGTIKGLKKGTLYLQKIHDTTMVTVDSIAFHGDGSFEFEQPLEHPELFFLHLDRADNNTFNDRLQFFGEAGQVTITTNWDEFDQAKINGSASQTDYEEYQNIISNFHKKDLELAQLAYNVQDTTKLDSLQTAAERNYLRRYGYILNFGLTHPKSYVTPFVTVRDGAEANPKYLDSVYNNLDTKVANSTYGKELAKLLKK